MIKKRKVRPQRSTMKPWDDRHHLSDSQNELLGTWCCMCCLSKVWAREFYRFYRFLQVIHEKDVDDVWLYTIMYESVRSCNIMYDSVANCMPLLQNLHIYWDPIIPLSSSCWLLMLLWTKAGFEVKRREKLPSKTSSMFPICRAWWAWRNTTKMKAKTVQNIAKTC